MRALLLALTLLVAWPGSAGAQRVPPPITVPWTEPTPSDLEQVCELVARAQREPQWGMQWVDEAWARTRPEMIVRRGPRYYQAWLWSLLIYPQWSRVSETMRAFLVRPIATALALEAWDDPQWVPLWERAAWTREQCEAMGF